MKDDDFQMMAMQMAAKAEPEDSSHIVGSAAPRRRITSLTTPCSVWKNHAKISPTNDSGSAHGSSSASRTGQRRRNGRFDSSARPRPTTSEPGTVISVISTVATARAKGMSLLRVPAFSWAMLVACSIWLFNLAAMVGNLVIGFQLEAIGEAMILATKAGLDPHDVLGVLHVTDFKSPIFDGVGGALLRRDFEVNFALKLMLKDANLISKFAQDLNVPLPGVAAIRENIKAGVNQGWGEENASAFIKYLEQAAGVQVKG